MNRASLTFAIGVNFLKCIEESVRFDIPSGFQEITNDASILMYRATMRLMDRVIVTLAENNQWEQDAVRLASHKVLCPVTMAHSESIGCASDKLLLAHGKRLFNPQTECGQYLLKLAHNRVSNEIASRQLSLPSSVIETIVDELSKVAWAYVIAIARQARQSSKGPKLTEPLVKQVLAHNVIFIKDKTIPNLNSPNGDLEQKATEAKADEETLVANVTMQRENESIARSRTRDSDIITNYTIDPKASKVVDDIFADDSFVANYTVNRNEPALNDSFDYGSMTSSAESYSDDAVAANYTLDRSDGTEMVGNYTMARYSDDDEDDFRRSTTGMVGNYTMGDFDEYQKKETDLVGNYTLNRSDYESEDEPSFEGENVYDRRLDMNRRPNLITPFGNNNDESDNDSDDDDGPLVRNVYIEGASPEVQEGDIQEAQALLQQAGIVPPIEEAKGEDGDEDEDDGEVVEAEGEADEDDEDDEEEGEEYEDDFETGGTFTDDTDFMPVSDITAIPPITETVDREQVPFTTEEHKDMFHGNDGMTVSSGCGCSGKGSSSSGSSIEYYNW